MREISLLLHPSIYHLFRSPSNNNNDSQHSQHKEDFGREEKNERMKQLSVFNLHK
jgi:hypothetical protein